MTKARDQHGIFEWETSPSRRANFVLGTMHRSGDDGPIENAVDKTGGNSGAWTPQDHEALNARMMDEEREYKHPDWYGNER